MTAGTDSAKTIAMVGDSGTELEGFARSAPSGGTREYEERETMSRVLEIGHHDGTLPPVAGRRRFGPNGGDRRRPGFVLQRGADRSSTAEHIIGEHCFSNYVYAPGPKKRIALRPIGARIVFPPVSSPTAARTSRSISASSRRSRPERSGWERSSA